MLFRRIYDDDLAQASYLIGCPATGQAVVVDPRRDIGVYLDAAHREGLTLSAVTETHIHADYLSGARELAHATGATLYLSSEGGPAWRYTFPHHALRHGSRIEVGRVTLEAVHTPGHTPEHLMFLLTDGATAHEPAMALTGDFVFVGEVGRPDLLDNSAPDQDTRRDTRKDTRRHMAQNLYQSLGERFLTLPDYVQVWPGHGAGSACGKALGALPCSTVGYERRFAWWAGPLARGDKAGFVETLLSGQPDAPSYFGRMKRHNRAGPPLRGERAPPLRLSPSNVKDRPDIVFVDTRARGAYLEASAPNSLHIPAGQRFVTYAAWVIDPENDPRSVVVLAADAAQATTYQDALSRVGIDRVRGYVTSLAGFTLHPVPTITPAALAGQQTGQHHPFILDVRTKSEFEAGHIPGASQLYAGRVMAHLETLPTDRSVIVHCQSGARSAVVASALRAAGVEVVELEGSYERWQQAQGQPVER